MVYSTCFGNAYKNPRFPKGFGAWKKVIRKVGGFVSKTTVNVLGKEFLINGIKL